MAVETTNQPADTGPATTPFADSVEADDFAQMSFADDAAPGEQAEQPPLKEGDEGYQPDPNNAQEEGGDVDQPEGEEGEAEEQAAEVDDAPQYWSAEDKALWAKVPADLKPLLQKYDHQREAYSQEKAREAAEVRQKAQAEVKQATDQIAQAATWWQENGPKFIQAFGDRWAGVNWTALSESNPAECQRLRIQMENEHALLVQANQRGEADAKIKQQRAHEEFMEARRTEHAKVATKLPDYFGTAEKSKETYDKLGNYLHSQGIPADRINSIHEAPIIEIALKAMRFDEAQKKASAVVNRDPNSGKFTATTTPTRVAPGPAQRTGSRASDAQRQVRERFNRTGEVADLAKLDIWNT